MTSSWKVFALGASLALSLAAACGDSASSTFGTSTDLDAAVETGPPPSLIDDSGNGGKCVPKTCAELDANCGPQGDGCGALINCGTCPPTDQCGNGGPSKCGKGNPNCVPKTCAGLGVNCGKQGDGCGGLIDCGTCTAPQICGGGGTPSKCGGGGPTADGGNCTPTKTSCAAGECGPFADGCGGLIQCGGCPAAQLCGGGGTPSMCGGTVCTPTTCAAKGATCGPLGDGCGGLLQCGTCTAPQICGGGGTPSKCGGGGPTPDGGNCAPTKTSCAAGECGPFADGCGGIIQCGGCAAPQTCGGGGTPSMCGGASGCVPTTCAAAGANCGLIGDGCGGTLNCGGPCPAPQVCGGGGVPSKCGGGGPSADGGNCTPTKTSCAPGDCGPIANGCGALLQCGGCTPPQICGGGVGGNGTPSKCGGGTLPDGGPVCTPKTCQQAGANCGPVGDGCGGLIASCGSCPFGQICGGGGTPSVCGPAFDSGIGDAGQVPCDGGSTTTLTGTVYAPNGVEPLYNAVVYVPTTAVQPFPPGVACNQCGADITGSPLVKAFTAPDGTFTLQNVPPGNNIPLVIQLGRWRRQVTIANVPACTSTPLAPALTRLPRNKGEGDIPLTAIATGNVDALECVLRKIGIDDAEFTQPAGTGRIKIYIANGADAGNGTPSWTALWSSLATLKTYDIVLLPCEGFPDGAVTNGPGTSAPQQNMIDYASAGGRVYATHYSYTWLSNTNTPADGPVPFSGTGNFVLDQPHPGDPNKVTGDIDTSFTKGQAFAQWLGVVNALSNVNPPKIAINISRHDMNGVVAPAQRWISVDPAGAPQPPQYPNYVNAPQHYTFNTPVGAQPANQCGRVLFSDFHVANAQTGGWTFPAECTNGPLTAQEKVLEFMLFDLANCITPDVPPTCTPRTCAQLGVQCGPAGDGCGGTLQCGNCPAGQTCGGGGTPSVCGGPTCTPTTCVAQNANCGMIGDNCGGTLSCGTCPNGQNCGGGGQANRCGVATCTPQTCQQRGVGCGPTGDGCGNIIDCGSCPAGQTCGGGGVPNQCGAPACTKRTCQQQNANCGPVADGCGGIQNCGPCTPPQTCGGGGVANQCGQPTCTPRTCQQMGVTCGPSGDGCGGTLDCGPCPPKCTPRTCQQANANCGLVADGCGGTLNCGTCIAPQTCGGGGTPNQCGQPTCTPRTCQQMGVTCGPSGDGCGGLLDCGRCPPNCTPRTCQQAGATCGQIADNCGGLIDCGSCVAPQSCGGGGTPNQCGGGIK